MRTSVTMLALTAGLWLHVSASSAQQRPATQSGGDTLYLTRRQAILLALRANPQVDIAREIALQARAQRVQATAINVGLQRTPLVVREYLGTRRRRFRSSQIPQTQQSHGHPRIKKESFF